LAGQGSIDSRKDLSHFPNQLGQTRPALSAKNRLKFPTQPPFGEENS